MIFSFRQGKLIKLNCLDILNLLLQDSTARPGAGPAQNPSDGPGGGSPGLGGHSGSGGPVDKGSFQESDERLAARQQAEENFRFGYADKAEFYQTHIQDVECVRKMYIRHYGCSSLINLWDPALPKCAAIVCYAKYVTETNAAPQSGKVVAFNF